MFIDPNAEQYNINDFIVCEECVEMLEKFCEENPKLKVYKGKRTPKKPRSKYLRCQICGDQRELDIYTIEFDGTITEYSEVRAKLGELLNNDDNTRKRLSILLSQQNHY